MQLQEKIREFSTSPGVYLMKNTKGEVLYVGKAKNLRARVLSYFRSEGEGDGRYQIRFLMKKVSQIEAILTQNEKEALLLENTLIKKHKPRYNVFLKDDKSYPSLKITVNHDFPRLFATRNVVKDGALYYGPYTSAFRLYEILNFIQNNFRLRTCSDHDFANRSRPCLQYQIKRCDAPCVAYVSKEIYAETVKEIRLFLEGRNQELEHLLEKRMNEAAEKLDYESAAYYRDLIHSVKDLLEKQQVLKHEGTSMDVWGLAKSAEKMVLVLLQVRHGSLMDKKEWVQATSIFQEDEESFSSFLFQYYKEPAWICPEILLPFTFSNQQALSELLSEMKQAKVLLQVPERGDKKARLALADQNAKEKLKQVLGEQENRKEILEKLKRLLNLKNLPRRMECYDISNLGADAAVGSCVCFVEGRPDKKSYRRFKIQYTQGPNDFAMHYEMMKRRLSHPEWEFPDLMIIDGGKGQLSSAYAALQDAGVTGVDIVGLAKEKSFPSPLRGEGRVRVIPSAPDVTLTQTLSPQGRGEGDKPERVYLIGRKDPIVPHPQSEECKLLVQIRDEAHRFGITYHRQLRGKKSITSLLDAVEGLGEKRKKLLLTKYQSPKNIFLKGLETVQQETKIPKEILEKLFQVLSEGPFSKSR
ncbi:MAG: excinuclease ABC subunit UvrC [Deltaproteobacteria bacterium]|nr:excinuclease ABC subunit UvrC [Deltaproteobacteria bacterium]